MLLAGAAAVLLASGPVDAADKSDAEAGGGSMWDVAFGVTFTTDYISRGLTQTNGGPAVQPWAELTVNDCFYIGYWGSNVDDGSVSTWENDLSIGVRPSLGPLDFDFGYVRYIYNDSAFADPSGEVYGKVSMSPVDPVTVGGALYYDPDAKNTYVEGNGSIDLHHNISVSGAVGVQSYGDGSASVTSWNAGASWSPYDWLTLDARYHAGPTANKFLVSLSLQSSLSALGVIH